MTLLLDTHFLIWITLQSDKLKQYSWLDGHRPWGVSPISLLEIQFLAEVGRLRVQQPQFSDAIAQDPRFMVDEAALVPLIRTAVALSWTRDPFDRLLAAHSTIRRVPLCTLDQKILEHHPLVPRELAG